jgi:hypothetical protein
MLQNMYNIYYCFFKITKSPKNCIEQKSNCSNQQMQTMLLPPPFHMRIIPNPHTFTAHARSYKKNPPSVPRMSISRNSRHFCCIGAPIAGILEQSVGARKEPSRIRVVIQVRLVE